MRQFGIPPNDQSVNGIGSVHCRPTYLRYNGGSTLHVKSELLPSWVGHYPDLRRLLLPLDRSLSNQVATTCNAFPFEMCQLRSLYPLQGIQSITSVARSLDWYHLFAKLDYEGDFDNSNGCGGKLSELEEVVECFMFPLWVIAHDATSSRCQPRNCGFQLAMFFGLRTPP